MPSATSPPRPVAAVWTSDSGSMAQQTAIARWPNIVQGMIDDVEKTAATTGPLQQDAARTIVQSLSKMKDEIANNQALSPLDAAYGRDIGGYNTLLADGGNYTWHASPWLFAECYMYRRVATIFAASPEPFWKTYDVFKRQKDETFAKSRTAVEELAMRYINATDQVGFASSPRWSEEQKMLFIEMTQVALWGNATDLSLLSNLSLDQIQGLQGAEAILKSRKNIVDDDTEDVWRYLSSTPSADRRIDIVLDNAGFEFYTDVVYAAYLLRSGIAQCIKFHVKDMPWFVSDVTLDDVDSLFQHLENHEIFPDRRYLDPLLRQLHEYFETGKMSIRQHPFWTTAYSFHAMEDEGAGIFKSLSCSSLVIFKGDLNYRKLTRDGLWPHTTSFAEAIGPLGKGSGLKILALRTNKADVCVGLESEEHITRLEQEAPGSAWVRNGKYAVISFSDGR
ncbi:hypothetical protein QM012_005085 [Aureobasidium pullulans]|uniref:Sugar phosphate phosphatase n=1 Tax=Aureobasidium pullulans TaxID=5580 RepID=A0ABR0T624_AURPU